MDAIGLGVSDGVMECSTVEATAGIIVFGASIIASFFAASFTQSHFDMPIEPQLTEGTLSSLESAFWTSLFCIVLTSILLLLCHLYPPSEIELMLDGVRSFGAHIQSLRSNRKTLQKVTIKAYGDYCERELLPVFQELIEIPHIQCFAADLRLPVTTLTYFLKGAPKLQSLSLLFQLKGSEGEIVSLAEIVRNHPSLQSICIENCNCNVEMDQSLDPFLVALADLSTLKTLSIYNLQSSAFVFHKLFQSTKIQTLKLAVTPTLHPRQVELLRTNGTLKTLCVPLHAGTQNAWAQVIENNTTLEHLTLVLEQQPRAKPQQLSNTTNTHHIDDDKNMDDVFLPIIKALASNSTLQSLALKVHENAIVYPYYNISNSYNPKETPVMSARCIQQVASSLRTNTSLKNLRLDPCSKTLHNEDKALLLQLAETIKDHNYTLTHFEMYTEGSRRLILPEMDFYLHCNHLQRGKVLRSTTTCQQANINAVVDFVIQHRTDTSTLFHILSEKPEVLIPCKHQGLM